jgi:mitogen-activated protein kinase organizer 1
MLNCHSLPHSYAHLLKFSNKTYRLRSTLWSDDSIVISGSEDGRIIAWDTVDARVLSELWHDESLKTLHGNKRNVISSVIECPARREWASAGGDGMFSSCN